MGKIRITKRFTFEAGHALYGHDGKCKNIHGHSYKLYAFAIPKHPEYLIPLKYSSSFSFKKNN